MEPEEYGYEMGALPAWKGFFGGGDGRRWRERPGSDLEDDARDDADGAAHRSGDWMGGMRGGLL